ncbi:hypothetical protein [Leptolyngbya iicbica]|uniref:Uncharacterized protein n=1 Tax=Lyngbya confervoides BDU141951 TaxID=1574623 RepID=A0A8T6QLF0_9CYAN|nr:hypothetical protein [Leptolyngbya sp. LK]
MPKLAVAAIALRDVLEGWRLEPIGGWDSAIALGSVEFCNGLGLACPRSFSLLR